MLESADSMERAGKILGAALRKLKQEDAPLAWLEAAWPAIVGNKLAMHTRPVGFQRGCLQVAVTAKDWQRQLEAMVAEFCERINRAWGGNLVREVKFSRAPSGPKRLAKEVDNEHTPFIRSRANRDKKAG